MGNGTKLKRRPSFKSTRRRPSFKSRRSSFTKSRRPSFKSRRQSSTSSYLLSVGTSLNDDLSYMTEDAWQLNEENCLEEVTNKDTNDSSKHCNDRILQYRTIW